MKKFTRRSALRGCGRVFCASVAGGMLAPFLDHGELFAAYPDRPYLKEALYWEKAPGGTVRCRLCPNACRLSPGERGICRARKNIGGSLVSLVYGRVSAVHVDPIEKKPFFHFLPGARALSIATAGCNMSCRFCQNWELSQSNPEDLEALRMTPDSLVRQAQQAGAKVVAYTYNEPTVQYEFVIDSAKKARAAGLRPVIVSNGYIMPDAGRALAKTLGAVKIDLKAFTEKFYRDVCGGGLAEVKQNLQAVHSTGVWMEIVVLVIPTMNDSPEEIRRMCAWIAKNLSPDVPVHFTRFRAMYRIQNLPPTPLSTLERCREIARAQGVRYPYIGNAPGHRFENTYCHKCGKMIVKRSGVFHAESRIVGGRCPHCSTRIPGVWA